MTNKHNGLWKTEKVDLIWKGLRKCSLKLVIVLLSYQSLKKEKMITHGRCRNRVRLGTWIYPYSYFEGPTMNFFDKKVSKKEFRNRSSNQLFQIEFPFFASIHTKYRIKSTNECVVFKIFFWFSLRRNYSIRHKKNQKFKFLLNLISNNESIKIRLSLSVNYNPMNIRESHFECCFQGWIVRMVAYSEQIDEPVVKLISFILQALFGERGKCWSLLLLHVPAGKHFHVNLNRVFTKSL